MAAAEQWRAVPGYPDYEVSDLGRLVSHKRPRTPRVLPGSPVDGYLMVALYGDEKRRTVGIHALVAEAFYGPRPEGQEVRHLNGDGLNNALSNLRYGTRSENSMDAVRHGTHPQARKTHCPQLHPYNELNTRHTPSGGRGCRLCERERARRYRVRQSLRAANVKAAA